MDLLDALLTGHPPCPRRRIVATDAKSAALRAARRVIVAFTSFCLLRLAYGIYIDQAFPFEPANRWQIGGQLVFMLVTGLFLWNLLQRLVGQLVEAQQSRLNAAHDLAARLAHAAEFRDGVTGRHLNRIACLVCRTALALGVDEDRAMEMAEAARLHDIGKIGVPDAVLLKPGRLTEEERRVMRTHVEIGGRLLETEEDDFLRLAHAIATTHHEWWNGQGYPLGLRGDAIPLEGRIVAVCDVYDALTSERPYKRAWSHDEAMDEMCRLCGSQFDPGVLHAFQRAVEAQRTARRSTVSLGTLAPCD